MRTSSPRRVIAAATSIATIASLSLTVATAATPAAAAVTPAAAPAALPAPQAPVIVGVSPAGKALNVAWNPPRTADRLARFRVQATPMAGSPAACVARISPVTAVGDTGALVQGLCTNVAYRATVTAYTAGGATTSEPSNPVVPAAPSAPDTPVVIAAFARPGAVSVRWNPPAFDGGAPLVDYTVTAGSAPAVTVPWNSGCVMTGVCDTVVPGLTNGVTVDVRVTAANAAGAAATAPVKVTPAANVGATAPMNVSAVVASTGAVKVAWNPPADLGSGTLTGYTVTMKKFRSTRVNNTTVDTMLPAGEVTQTVTGGASNAILSKLDSGKDITYAAMVTATTTAGAGRASALTSQISANVALTSAAVVLSTADTAGLSGAAGQTLTFTASPMSAQVAGLVPGKILVAGSSPTTPKGLLRRVVGVTKSNASTVVVTTAEARLSDAVTAIGFAASANPLDTSSPLSSPGAPVTKAPTFAASAPGVRASVAPAGVGFSHDFTAKLSTPDDGSGVTTETSLTLTPSVSMSATTGWSSVTLTTEAGVKLALSGKASFYKTALKEWEKKIGEYTGSPIDIQVGPVPVVLFPHVELFLTASGSVTAKAGMAFEASAEVTAKAIWSSADGMSFEKSPPTFTGSVAPDFALTAKASAGVSVRPGIYLYGMTGPELNVDAAVEANADLSQAEWLTVGPKISAGLSWVIDIGIWSDSWGPATFYESSFGPWLKWTTNKPVPAIITPTTASVAAGGSYQFRSTVPTTWRIARNLPGESISPTGLVKTVAASPGRTLDVRAIDTKGRTVGSATLTVGPVVATPAVTVTPAGDGTSAVVSWPKVDATATTRYLVTTTPSTGVQSTTGTQATVTGLVLGRKYLVSVVAVAASGVRSRTGTVWYATPASPVTNRTVIDKMLTITPANPVGTFTFTASAGQHLWFTTIRGTLTSTQEKAVVQITGPGLWGNDADYLVSSYKRVRTAFVAPFTGVYTYTITPRVYGSGTHGDYGTVRVMAQNLAMIPTVVPNAGTTVVRLSPSAPAGLFAFQVEKGKHYYLSARSDALANQEPEPTWDVAYILRADWHSTVGGGGLLLNGGGRRTAQDFVARETAIYTFVAFAPFTSDYGPVTVALQTSDGVPTTTVNSAPSAVTMAPDAPAGLVKVAATAGQRITCTTTRTSFVGGASTIIYGPDGTPLFSVPLFPDHKSDTWEFTAPVTGVYTYRIVADAAYGTVTVAFQTADGAPTATLNGAPVTAALTVTAPAGFVKVAATAGQRITCTTTRTTFAGSASAVIYGPDGQVTSQILNSSDKTAASEFTAPVTGVYTYRIVADAAYGTVTVAFQTADGAPTATLNGAPVTAALTVTAPAGFVKVAATAGRRIDVTTTRGTLAGSASVVMHGPDGALAMRQTLLPADTSATTQFTAPVTGVYTYRIVADAAYGDVTVAFRTQTS